MEVDSNANRVVHFPNLNGLRFLAAFVVLIHHVEQYRNIYGETNLWSNPAILWLGEEGVTLFFVLSGFLITYLLLAEKEKFGQIAIKQFYFRRILRIWPLYFFIVFISFCILPKIHFFDIPSWTQDVYKNLEKKILLFLVVLPNAALSLYGVVPYLAQSWSIGTEEQFYLFWPLIVQKTNKYLLIFSLLSIAYISFKYSLHLALVLHNTFFLRLLNDFLYWFRIESMFIGSLVAVLLFFNYSKILNILRAPVVQLIVLAVIVILMTLGYQMPLNSEIYSILFSILILNLASSPKPIINLENSILNYLGRISYGLYMLQSIAIVSTVRLMAMPCFENLPNWLTHLLTIVFSLFLLIILATLSYSYLEKPFLKYKHKFMFIKSRA